MSDPTIVEIYIGGELVETRHTAAPVTRNPLAERIADLEARLADVAEGVDVSLDPAATPGRKQTMRDRLRAIIEGAQSPSGKEVP